MPACEKKVITENITKVLYPNDNIFVGQGTAPEAGIFPGVGLDAGYRAPLQERQRRSGACFPDKVAIQLNDTHPALAIPELMRILIDEEGLDWDDGLGHHHAHLRLHQPHLLPEALEEWPVSFSKRCCRGTWRLST